MPSTRPFRGAEHAVLSVALVVSIVGCTGSHVIDDPSTLPTVPVLPTGVAPATASLTVGQTIALTARVAAGAAAPVWSSGDSMRVSVTQAGKATALAVTPGIEICAGSAPNARAIGCATLIVR